MEAAAIRPESASEFTKGLRHLDRRVRAVAAQVVDDTRVGADLAEGNAQLVGQELADVLVDLRLLVVRQWARHE